MLKHFFLSLLIVLPLQLFSGSTASIAPVVSYLLSDNKDLGRIMPLGDSITWDWYYGDSRPASLLHSYRSHLWWKLKEKGYTLDFVGSRSNGAAITPHFDGNNEGYTGQICDFISSNIYGWLSKNPANTVLLHIGTNDSVYHSTSMAVSHVENILNEIDRYERDHHVTVHVILAKIIKLYRNGSSGYNWVIDFNRRLGTMAQSRINWGDSLVLVDMQSGAGLNYPGDLIDGIHPTNCGYEKMANLWYKALAGKDAPELQYCH